MCEETVLEECVPSKRVCAINAFLMCAQGLGEVYEEQYVKNVVGHTAEDKDEKVRNDARMLFQVRLQFLFGWYATLQELCLGTFNE